MNDKVFAAYSPLLVIAGALPPALIWKGPGLACYAFGVAVTVAWIMLTIRRAR